MELNHGITRMSVICVRSTPSDKAELITQLLFGQIYTVISYSDDRKWLYIRIEEDGMEGWIDVKQVHFIEEAFFEYQKSVEHKISLDISSTLLIRKQSIPITMGSILPFTESGLFQDEVQVAYNGLSKPDSQRRDSEFLLEQATRLLGVPYMWGGKTPFGIDCSGFTQLIYRVAGYKLKRDSYQQAEQGKTIETLDDAHPGDLLFFATDGKVNHVGIFYGEGRVIHASGMVRLDEITSEGIIHTETKVLTHNLFRIKRLLS